MKDYVINELEKLFKESNDSFVTIMANGKFIGNYCTESYKDVERLFDDMCRHDLTINDISLKKIEMGDDPKEEYLTNTISLTNKIEKLKKELDDKRSALQSTTVAKQAADYEHYQFVQKKEALEDFVDHFNGTHNDDEYMKLTKVNRTKVVLWYVTRHATRLKKFISFYDDLNLDAIQNDIALYHIFLKPIGTKDIYVTVEQYTAPKQIILKSNGVKTIIENSDKDDELEVTKRCSKKATYDDLNETIRYLQHKIQCN